MGIRLWCTAVVLLLAGCGGGGGGGGSSGSTNPPAATFTDPAVYSGAATASLQGAAEITTTTKAQLAVGGVTLNYTATAGHLTALALGNGAAQASFFYVAYTLDGAAPATRPLTFFYNGGPGSASAYLHLGSFGPKRLAVNAPSTSVPTPFALVDNAESLLDVTDMVFVDAVGTGYSQAIAPFSNRTFWGVDADAAVFRDYVMTYVAKNGRSASPRFLFGESYGAPRTAILARLLETAGLPLKGVVLQSSALDYNSNCGISAAPTVACTGYVPSFGAAGSAYGLDNPNPAPADLPAYLAQVKTLATSQFDPAVRRLLASGIAPDPALLAQLANATGLSIDKWQARFNVGPTYYRGNLKPGTVIGRYDARVNAPAGSALAADDDPSITFINGSFASTVPQYLGTTLRYTTPSAYVLSGNAIDTWDFSHGGLDLPDTIPDLAAALALDPNLKVLSVGGYHDLATPFFLTDADLGRLGVNAPVSARYYSGGHMTYLDNQSRALEKADIAQFYSGATGAAKSGAVAPMAAAALVTASVPLLDSPPATFDRPLRDPWVPEALAKSAVARPAPTQGAALRAQVEAKLRESFNAADRDGLGTLTREQASAAGFGFVSLHFAAIDTRGAGSVRFEDLLRFLREREAKAY
jgi:carboxypeptidase C (cathepsin A)